MTLKEAAALSYYRQIGVLSEEHGVYLVQHLESRELYVKKVLTVYDAAVYRFLKQNHIVGTPFIYEVVEDKGVLIVIEEYVSGISLQKILDEEKILSEEKAFEVVRQICGILEVMHGVSHPLIHRDIKPSNIIISSDGVVTLLDMNAAKRYNAQEAMDTRLIGTFGYAAPEQYGFGSSGVQTDIYSLGVLLNVMLTGDFPQKRRAIGRAGEIVAKCTKVDMADRYQSAHELLQAINGETPEEKKGFDRRFLPPGFRSGDPLHMVLGSIIYLVLLVPIFRVDLELPFFKDLAVKLLIDLILLSEAFYFGNYLNVWEKLGIYKYQEKSTRVGLVLVYAGFLWFGWFLIIAILGGLF